MPGRTSHRELDGLQLLAAEHASIDRLFLLAGGASTDDARAGLAARIGRALSVHASLEEELFYPAASQVLTDDRLVLRAEVEHAAIKEIVRRVETLQPSDPRFGPTLKVLEEYVRHHVAEEEQRLFPRLLHSPLDLRRLGAAFARRRHELAARLGTVAEPLDDAAECGAQPRPGESNPQAGMVPASKTGWTA